MLAQEWLYGNRVETEYDRLVEKHLALPTEFNPKSSLVLLNHLAERIVFTDDVPSMLYEMHANKQLTYRGVIASAKLPYDCFWLEFNTEVGADDENDIAYMSCGALIRRLGDIVRMYIISGVKPSEHEYASTLTHIIDFNQWPPLLYATDVSKEKVIFSIRYAFNEGRIRNSPNRLKAMGEVGCIVCEIIFGIFLITQPKVYTEEVIKWNKKKQARRALSKKPPLLEYRKIRVHVMKPTKHYTNRPAIARDTDIEGEAAIIHRRYHKVMGHFRHYNNSNPPHTTWIEPHYRGDPKLGITFTERDVSR